jgi:hypothetical protein
MEEKKGATNIVYRDCMTVFKLSLPSMFKHIILTSPTYFPPAKAFWQGHAPRCLRWAWIQPTSVIRHVSVDVQLSQQVSSTTHRPSTERAITSVMRHALASSSGFFTIKKRKGNLYAGSEK